MKRNQMKLEFLSLSVNESFARVAVAAFASQLDPTLEELSDIKIAVSEAVTNAIIHGYEDQTGTVVVRAVLEENTLTVEVEDFGKGIADVALARQPLYTSKPEMERSGMGFTVMERLMDSVEVESTLGRGTLVRMVKHIGENSGTGE